ncbi:uncharacterized protein RHO17_000901 isoform 4-T4 [Thomomys bottae]
MLSRLPALLWMGLYDTPTLSVYPGPQVALGEPVTFCCRLETATTTFFLLKKGWPRHQQRRKGVLQAEFSMGPATLSHRGTYQCFGSYNDHLWSFPSKPVTLAVTGDVENASLATTDPPASSPEGPCEDYTPTPGRGLQQGTCSPGGALCVEGRGGRHPISSDVILHPWRSYSPKSGSHWSGAPGRGGSGVARGRGPAPQEEGPGWSKRLWAREAAADGTAGRRGTPGAEEPREEALTLSWESWEGGLRRGTEGPGGGQLPGVGAERFSFSVHESSFE